MHRLWIAAATLTFLGCATPPPPAIDAEPSFVEEVKTPVASTANVVCTTGSVTGSHIVRRRCVTREQQESVSKSSQQWLRSGGQLGAPVVVGTPAEPLTRDAE